MTAPSASSAAPIDLSLRLTAVALLLRPMGPWFVRPALLALAVVLLIAPRQLRSAPLWTVIAVLIGARIVDDWPLADNHIYLLAYWAWAIALALRAATPELSLAWSSRWLIGLAFLFAVTWKVLLSPDFLDGRFFRVTLLTDPRFGDVAQLVGGLSAEQLRANREALQLLPEGAALLQPSAVVEPFRLVALAAVSTFGITALESGVAALMLWPVAGRLFILRHVALLAFCTITYLFAPVAGFGWLLLAMGLAQLSPERDPAIRRAYVIAFIVVIFYGEIPWADLTLGLLGR